MIRATYGLHVGEKVTVWYDPASPSDSAIRNYPPADLAVMKYATYVAAAVSAVALAFAVVGLL
jgi:hypothetical protein